MIPDYRKQKFIMFLWFYFFTALPKLTVQYNTNRAYCNITCDGKSHTMCAYPDKGGPECSSFTRGLSAEQVKTIIQVHNELRNMVATGKDLPPAANMMRMVWSREGAKIAQRWADQCTQLNPDSDYCRTLLNGETGGQLVTFTGKMYVEDTFNFIRTTLMDWYHTNKTYVKSEDLASFKYNQKTFAYMQLMWAKSDQVGCGLSIGEVDHEKVHKLVCNYYPAGNVPGEPVYEQGDPCSRCPYVRCDAHWYSLCDQEINPNNDVTGAAPGNGMYPYGFVLIITTVIMKLYLV